MRKITIPLLLCALLFNLVSSTSFPKSESISGCIVFHMKDNKIISLELKVENLQEDGYISFSNGDNLKCTIRQNSSNKIISDYKENSTIILRPKQAYSKNIPIDQISDKGIYDVTFIASSDSGTTIKNLTTFNVE